MQIAIYDNNEEDIDAIQESLKNYFSDKSLCVDIIRFQRSTDLLYEIEDGKNFDIIFINADSAITTARELRNENYSGEIIFIARSSSNAVDGYEVNACGYVLLPLSEKKLFEAMDRAMRSFSEDVYLIKHRGDIIALPLNEILFIESSNSKCIIHEKSGRCHTVYTQLRKIEEELNDPRFLRCHQSYIVNMNHICRADKCFELVTGDKILIRQRNIKEIRNIYLEYAEK